MDLRVVNKERNSHPGPRALLCWREASLAMMVVATSALLAFAFGCGDDDKPTGPDGARLGLTVSLSPPTTIDGALTLRAIRAAARLETTLVEQTLNGAVERLDVSLTLEPGQFFLSADIRGSEHRPLGATEPGLLYRGSQSITVPAGGMESELALASVVPRPALTVEPQLYVIAWDSIPEAEGYNLKELPSSFVRNVNGTHASIPFPPSLRSDGAELLHRVSARLGDDESAYSEAIRVELPPQIPPAAIEDLHVVAEYTSPTRLALGWTAPGDDGDIGTATAYDIRWSREPIDSSNFFDIRERMGGVPYAAGSSELYFLDGLTPATQYYCAVVTIDDADNRSELSNVAPGSTSTPQDSLPPGVVEDLVAVALDENRVRLTWTAPFDDEGRVFEYELKYDTQPISRKTFPDLPSIVTGTPHDPGTEESIVAGDLLRETSYYFAIRSLDEDGNASELSNVAKAITPDLTAPARIQSLVVRQVGSTFVILTWNAVGDDGQAGVASTYDLRRSATPVDESNFEEAESVPGILPPSAAGKSERFEVSGLAPSTSYYFALRAVDESGNRSEVSNSVQATTSR